MFAFSLINTIANRATGRRSLQKRLQNIQPSTTELDKKGGKEDGWVNSIVLCDLPLGNTCGQLSAMVQSNPVPCRARRLVMSFIPSLPCKIQQRQHRGGRLNLSNMQLLHVQCIDDPVAVHPLAME